MLEISYKTYERKHFQKLKLGKNITGIYFKKSADPRVYTYYFLRNYNQFYTTYYRLDRYIYITARLDLNFYQKYSQLLFK